uniref:Uncharacterized protein n=1 Tax=Anguilla anguilla TaxID=7936 RepID=A0A0E9VVU8_ANGAN
MNYSVFVYDDLFTVCFLLMLSRGQEDEKRNGGRTVYLL